MKLRLVGIFNTTQPKATPDEKSRVIRYSGIIQQYERIAAAGCGAWSLSTWYCHRVVHAADLY